MKTALLLALAFVFLPAKISVAQSSTSSPKNAPVQVNHVFILLEENHSFEQVIGNAQMPYLNNLANTYSLSYGYFANTHPSIGNYFMLTTGQIITNDDGYGGTVDVDNVVRELLAAAATAPDMTEFIIGD